MYIRFRFLGKNARLIDSLQLARFDDGGAFVVFDGAALGPSSLEGFDDVHGLLVGDLAENDVSAVEPGGDNSGDEELGAVSGQSESAAIYRGIVPRTIFSPALSMLMMLVGIHLRVRTGVGHGQQTRAVVLQLETLIGEPIAVDGFATSALWTL